MPKKLTMWKCQFGCQRVSTYKTKMTKHEKRCLYNPMKRACQTCQYRHITLESDVERIYTIPYCVVREDVDLQKRLECDCEAWKEASV